MKYLALHSACKSTSCSVAAQWQVEGSCFNVKFKVECSELNISDSFKVDSFDNWGLWEFDVVELFVRKGCAMGPYLELQASPKQQFFALMVIEPRKKTQHILNSKTQIVSKKTDSGFEVTFRVPLEEIPGEGSHLEGNLFSCLGKVDQRSYFALNPNPQQRPDFHRPELFIELGKI